MTVHLRQAVDAESLRQTAALCREYAASLPFSLDFQGFDEELRTLPGKYAPPRGTILLAFVGPESDSPAEPIGCIALRPILDENTCEMKRMYVRPAGRGLGVGRLLADALIRDARTIGYRRMMLDSDRNFTPALTLYQSLGFRFVERYNDDMHPDTVFMQLEL